MRNAFIPVLLLLISLQEASAQRISTDQIEKGGVRSITTKPKSFFIGRTSYNFGINAYIDKNDDAKWMLSVSSYQQIPNNTEILLKLGNEEIIHLCIDNVHTKQIRWGYTVNTDTDFYVSEYGINQTDIDKISKYGITKIRISNSTEFKDRIFKNDYLGSLLTECMKNIQERLREQSKEEKKDIHDGF